GVAEGEADALVPKGESVDGKLDRVLQTGEELSRIGRVVPQNDPAPVAGLARFQFDDAAVGQLNVERAEISVEHLPTAPSDEGLRVDKVRVGDFSAGEL